VLVWDGLPYHKANLLGLMGGSNPVGNAGVPGITNAMSEPQFVSVAGIEVAERLLLPVLTGLEQSGYPYKFLRVPVCAGSRVALVRAGEGAGAACGECESVYGGSDGVGGAGRANTE